MYLFTVDEATINFFPRISIRNTKRLMAAINIARENV